MPSPGHSLGHPCRDGDRQLSCPKSLLHIHSRQQHIAHSSPQPTRSGSPPCSAQVPTHRPGRCPAWEISRPCLAPLWQIMLLTIMWASVRSGSNKDTKGNGPAYTCIVKDLLVCTGQWELKPFHWFLHPLFSRLPKGSIPLSVVTWHYLYVMHQHLHFQLWHKAFKSCRYHLLLTGPWRHATGIHVFPCYSWNIVHCLPLTLFMLEGGAACRLFWG